MQIKVGTNNNMFMEVSAEDIIQEVGNHEIAEMINALTERATWDSSIDLKSIAYYMNEKGRKLLCEIVEEYDKKLAEDSDKAIAKFHNRKKKWFFEFWR